VHKVEVTTPKDGQGKVAEVTTPKDGQGKVTMKLLLSWVKDNLIKERPEMFVKGDSVYVLFRSPLSSLTCVGSMINIQWALRPERLCAKLLVCFGCCHLSYDEWQFPHG